MIRHGDRYYFTATLEPEGGLWVWRSPTLTGLDEGEKVRVWTAPETGRLNSQIWAPELHRLEGGWYLYFTASDGIDANHRHYVLEAETDDPMGPYKDPVRVDPEWDRYAIDASVLEATGACTSCTPPGLVHRTHDRSNARHRAGHQIRQRSP